MAEYRISGIWKDSNGVITDYAFHEIDTDTRYKAKKVSKSNAIARVENRANTVKTWVWNYRRANWVDGEDIHVSEGQNGKYLRSDPDNSLTDNLEHLIDFDWIYS
ncbi:MAG TPA: hypothetical protein DCX41_05250 [Aequorivita sp.]|nr:hypothetical protein [Pusillimonas sp.]HAV54325.1 hypothetical protein [Aequorivita sp.]|tara:strand:+ start:30222 stop:30536 length:315 start_codon:yes stop_codon:yes gene_type:complete